MIHNYEIGYAGRHNSLKMVNSIPNALLLKNKDLSDNNVKHLSALLCRLKPLE